MMVVILRRFFINNPLDGLISTWKRRAMSVNEQLLKASNSTIWRTGVLMVLRGRT
ncbi:hypothetical protein M5119_14420 [Lacticaseibacillus paracasei]|nr:hypothetical protein [Lacticaseibacillus paracasei]MBU6046009.1 hypothetical protein [Lacticaseibacillus paracasei]MBU6048550.1 hypothetical protein [Lacticaseibacillus paracasei]MCL4970833.1 hypothetical protein [Lacticaseibacillus paracasei]MCL4973355.1 hypothetical protein [Lacticaseibacillus paracasei]